MSFFPPLRPARSPKKPARARLTVETLEDRVLLASSLGAAGDFNVFAFARITQNYSDSEGRVAAGSDVSLTGYGLGDRLTNSAGGRDDLVVAAT